jgi:hypothetical protein
LCPLPAGATRITGSGQSEVDVIAPTTPGTNPQPLGLAVMSCLYSQSYPRLLERFSASQQEDVDADDGLSSVSGVADGDFVALLNVDADLHYGGYSEQVAVFDAASGEPVSSADSLTAICAGDDESDGNLEPASPCGIDGMVVAPDGDYAVEDTVPQYGCAEDQSSPPPAGDATDCWFQAVIEHTGSGNTVVGSLDTTGPTDGAGITALELTGTTLSWEANGAAETAQLN